MEPHAVPSNKPPTLVSTKPADAPITPSRDPSLLESFFLAETVNEALEKNGWSPEREISLLLAMAEDVGTPGNVKIAALEALRRRQLDSLRLSGRLATLTSRAVQATGPEGDTSQEAIAVVQTMRLLKEAVHSPHTIVAPRKETTHDDTFSTRTIGLDGDHAGDAEGGGGGGTGSLEGGTGGPDATPLFDSPAAGLEPGGAFDYGGADGNADRAV